MVYVEKIHTQIDTPDMQTMRRPDIDMAELNRDALLENYSHAVAHTLSRLDAGVVFVFHYVDYDF